MLPQCLLKKNKENLKTTLIYRECGVRPGVAITSAPRLGFKDHPYDVKQFALTISRI